MNDKSYSPARTLPFSLPDPSSLIRLMDATLHNVSPPSVMSSRRSSIRYQLAAELVPNSSAVRISFDENKTSSPIPAPCFHCPPTCRLLCGSSSSLADRGPASFARVLAILTDPACCFRCFISPVGGWGWGRHGNSAPTFLSERESDRLGDEVAGCRVIPRRSTSARCTQL